MTLRAATRTNLLYDRRKDPYADEVMKFNMPNPAASRTLIRR
jgi:hypothetical protein